MSVGHFGEIERIGDGRLTRHDASGGYYAAWYDAGRKSTLERSVSIDVAGGIDAN